MGVTLCTQSKRNINSANKKTSDFLMKPHNIIPANITFHTVWSVGFCGFVQCILEYRPPVTSVVLLSNSQWACPAAGTWRWLGTHDGGSFRLRAAPQGSSRRCTPDQSRWERPSGWGQVSSPQCDPFPILSPALVPAQAELVAVAKRHKTRDVESLIGRVL